MSTYTPGPWFWSQGVDDWELVGADANRVLFCWNDSTKWKSGLVIGEHIKDADARLIAATPDMYEALKEIVAAWPHRCSVLEFGRLIEKACAALAKVGMEVGGDG